MSATPCKPTAFKVCCIQSIAEADAAIDAGAVALGLVGAMPNGPGQLDDDQITAIAAHIHQRTGGANWATLLTSRTTAADIIAHVDKTGVNTVQIVDWPTPDLEPVHRAIRAARPDLRVFQVIHVENETAIAQAQRAAASADVLLLDSGAPSATTRTLGGTGLVHDWSISKKIIESCGKPVFLAGGLTPDNVKDAVGAVQPYGVDICSGIRDKDRQYALNLDKLKAFADALRED